MRVYNWSQILSNFHFFLDAEKLSKLTIKNYLADVRLFVFWLLRYVSTQYFIAIETLRMNHNLSLQILNDGKTKVIPTYVAYLQSFSYSTKTVNRRIYSLQKFVRFLEQEGLIKPQNYQYFSNLSLKITHKLPLKYPSQKASVLTLFSKEISKQGNESQKSQQLSDLHEFYQYLQK